MGHKTYNNKVPPMSMLSSQHHSFDIALAARYGVEEAIFIHHFMHWIRINRAAGRNIKEGRCWTYQSRKEIALHFPYWNLERVRYLGDKLVEMGVIITGNFNKSKMDKTIWYAFVNEKQFGLDEESSKNLYERENPHSSAEIPNSCGKIDTPIPDSKSSDSKSSDKGISNKPPISKCKPPKSAAPPISAEAESLCDHFLSKIRERNPKFKEPNLQKWLKEFDLLLRVDNRNYMEAGLLIEWASTHKWWKVACISPSKLRKDFDAMTMQMQADFDRDVVRSNRNYAVSMKEKYPEKLKGLTFDDKFAMNRFAGKEVPFNLPQETFRQAFLGMFGGREC